MNENKKIRLERLADYGRKNPSLASTIPKRVLELRKKIIKESFCSPYFPEHQREFVRNIEGVDYINDSHACSVHCLWFSIEETKSPIILITGGTQRNQGYSKLGKELLTKKLSAIILLGENPELTQHLNGTEIPIIRTTSLEEAVETAQYLSKPKDTILFSPGCPSFEIFENYEERGRKFSSIVKKL